MTAHDHYQKGRLRESVAAALEEVKQRPTDPQKRGFLAEVLCLTGDLERADRQLDALGQPDPETLMEVNLFRQLIRAEQARQQFYADGRIPEFLNHEITPDLRLHLEAAVLLRDGKSAQAAAVLAKAKEQQPKVAGTCNGKPFEDLCDLDDLTSSFFEVLSSKGEYYWIPFDRVESLEFGAWTRPRDLLWRCAQMIVRDGPDAEVYLPVLYAGSAADTNDQIRLGRATEWRGEADAPVRGIGQRIFLVGEEDCPILELQKLTFEGMRRES
jgi:type VI secretion system protein ImpE